MLQGGGAGSSLADAALHAEWRFASRLADLNRVIDGAVQFIEAAGADARTVYVAHLAIEELGTNILKYGFDDDAIHEVLLQVEVRCGAVRIVIQDDGHPFNPLELPEPEVNRPVDQRLPGGLGIHLVRKMVDQFDYEWCAGHNRVSVRIDSRPDAPPSAS